MYDLHNRSTRLPVIAPVAVGTTGTGKTGKIIDRAGYEAVEFELSYGTITSSTAVFTATVMEGDATGAMASAADVDLIGSEAAAGLAAGARTSGVSKNCVKSIGYKGIKRYVSCNVKSTATAATPVAVTAVLGHARSGA